MTAVRSEEREPSRSPNGLSTRFPVVSHSRSAQALPVSTQRLRLVTFNIAHGRGLTPIQGLTSSRKLRLNLRRIADLLGELGADLVALQEIDECSVWAGSFDHLDYLRAHAGFPHAAFGINNRRSGLMNLCYGNAILSRFPIVETETIVFGKRRLGEKGFLFAEINVGAGSCRSSTCTFISARGKRGL